MPRTRCSTSSLSRKVRLSSVVCVLRSCIRETDGTARDITPRYAKSYNTVTVKARGPSKKGTDWFADLLLPYQRAFQLVRDLLLLRLVSLPDLSALQNRDREEEEELWNRRANAPMPTSVAGFKNHPRSVLSSPLLPRN